MKRGRENEMKMVMTRLGLQLDLIASYPLINLWPCSVSNALQALSLFLHVFPFKDHMEKRM